MFAAAALLVILPLVEKHSELNLVSATSTIVEGKPFVVALQFTMDANWHIYWRNPGDSGQQPRVVWQAPKGWTISSLRWPAPEFHADSDINTYVYEGRATLLATVIPRHIRQKETLKANVNWLVCSDVCLPQSKALSLTFTRAKATKPTASAASILQAEKRARRTMLRAGRATVSGGEIIMQVKQVPAGTYEFFPYQADLVKHAKYVGESDGRSITFTLGKSPYFNEKPTYLDGILVPRDAKAVSAGAGIYEIGVPLLKQRSR